MVSVSDSVSFRFFSESRIQYRIRLDMGMIPDSDSSTQKLVSPTSGLQLFNESIFDKEMLPLLSSMAFCHSGGAPEDNRWQHFFATT